MYGTHPAQEAQRDAPDEHRDECADHRGVGGDAQFGNQVDADDGSHGGEHHQDDQQDGFHHPRVGPGLVGTGRRWGRVRRGDVVRHEAPPSVSRAGRGRGVRVPRYVRGRGRGSPGACEVGA